MKDVLSEPENIGSQTSNNKMMNKEKEACKDLKSTKTCKKLKKKNEGKGCENKSVKKKCRKTCGLCDIGKSFSCNSLAAQYTICRMRLLLSFLKNIVN